MSHLVGKRLLGRGPGRGQTVGRGFLSRGGCGDGFLGRHLRRLGLGRELLGGLNVAVASLNAASLALSA